MLIIIQTDRYYKTSRKVMAQTLIVDECEYKSFDKQVALYVTVEILR